jgi:hypothetical protein
LAQVDRVIPRLSGTFEELMVTPSPRCGALLYHDKGAQPLTFH